MDVSNSESGDDSIQGPAGGVGPPVVPCVLSDVTKSGLHRIGRQSALSAGCHEFSQ